MSHLRSATKFDDFTVSMSIMILTKQKAKHEWCYKMNLENIITEFNGYCFKCVLLWYLCGSNKPMHVLPNDMILYFLS